MNGMKKSIYLCGFMGCGKTTAGKCLARRLNISCEDMDAYIQTAEGRTIPEIFSAEGEEYFRERETEAVSEMGSSGGVISCGGGAMLREKNAAAARRSGCVVYIDTPFELCYSRISGDKNRPIVMANTKESLEELYNKRKRLYESNSDFSVNGSGTPDEIAEEITENLYRIGMLK